MGGVFSLVFGLMVAVGAGVWLVRRRRAAQNAALCPNCRRWHENTCQIAGRPEITRCRFYSAHQPPPGPLRTTEGGSTVIDWDWEDEY